MKPFNVLCVIGTRPEALKMIPVVQALRHYPGLAAQVVITGQHRELVAQILKDQQIENIINFDVMEPNQTLNRLSANLFNHFDKYFKTNPCDLVIAQGDTTTTLVAATSAFYNKLPFAHVESGLRTSSITNPFPEEFNRRVTTLAATLHFCPTTMARDNLIKEGIKEHVYVTGNTIIDMLYDCVSHLKPAAPSQKKLIVVTCHRRENFGEPLVSICNALKQLAETHEELDILLPVHPNPNVKQVIEAQLSTVPNIQLTSPLDYPELVSAMKRSYLVLTDSGGLQEEAPALGKPVLVLRNETERPEAVACGASRLVGTETNTIVAAVEELLENPLTYETMAQAGSPYGDGQASKRIATLVHAYLVEAAQQRSLGMPA